MVCTQRRSRQAVNSNAGSNYVYSYDQNLNRFCLTTYQGDTAYYASTSDATPHEGRCQDNNRLVGWWKLNGNTDDSSELGNNATVHGGAVPTISQNGIGNHAYAFNGSSDFLSTTVSSEVNDLFATSGQSWTATAWFKNTRPNGSSSVIIGRGGGTGSSATFGLSVNSSNNLFAALRGNSTTIGPVDDTTWYFGAVSWDGQTARGYLNDAAPVNLGVGTASLQDYNFKIGATANGNNHFPGSIDDVRLFSRALSVSELADMYQRGAE
ncbi:LamG domain-containing protein [Candidatus Saccharibacteria bacterium]|nr:LamG domain-containing protein [Candidatus Saccharibacteria bacterium]